MDIISNVSTMMNWTIFVSMILLSLFLAVLPTAMASVAVVIEFPNGTVYSHCVKVSDGKSVYDVLKNTGLDVQWSDDGQWGRALCKIEGFGSDPSGEGCSDWSSYWAFSLSLDKDSDWTTHAPVGFTAGSCWNRDYQTPSYDGHYCTKDGDVIGLHYTSDFPSGYPPFFSFDDICGKDDKGPIKKGILMSSRPFWEAYSKACGIDYDGTLPPQNLRDMCDEKRRNDAMQGVDTFGLQPNGNSTDNLIGNLTANYTAANFYDPLFEPIVTYTYEPKIITHLGEPFKIFLSSGGFALSGMPVSVNGLVYTTAEDGSITFGSMLGDYLIETNYPGFKNFKVIFRIGG